jgi:subtilisin family serine protease
MAKRRGTRTSARGRTSTSGIAATADELLLATLQAGGDPAKTGRFIVTFKQGATNAGTKSLKSRSGLRMASARDFTGQAVDFSALADADGLVFPEIGVALVTAQTMSTRGLSAQAIADGAGPVQSVDPEFFMFATDVDPAEYLRGFMAAAKAIAADLAAIDVVAQVAGVTWGLNACRVPMSVFNGTGIRVAVLDTGFDVGHPEFAGRSFVTSTFAGQPVQDLNGHGTHTAGTAAGPNAPAGPFQRYGIAFRSSIYIGKVLTNSGSGTQAQVLAGMNWAIANRCPVISMSLGAQIPVQPSYTAAGTAALNNGCLIIAAAGNASNRPGSIQPAGAPANSPTIVSVAALDTNLRVAIFSNGGKIDIAAPGVNVFSSWPRPTLHNTISGTSMATPHVAGCAALWAHTSAALRGNALRARLLATARVLPLPGSDVGAGLVQAP